jgi:hypothetical protein
MGEWPTPQGQNKSESFLGLASYYMCFVKNFVNFFAQIVGPLIDLLKRENNS